MITACAIMLTQPGREEMIARAIVSFESQTYPHKHLVIDGGQYGSIGEKRNAAIKTAIQIFNPDVLLTFDDDDWSHPRRIEEQVVLLESSGADIVGYYDLLFWRDPEAWLYRSHRLDYVPGTTQAFTRRTWERGPYRPVSDQEDYHFGHGRRVFSTSSIVDGEPRMVATIHGSNTMQAHYDRVVGGRNTAFTKAPEWDEYCRQCVNVVTV